MSTELAESAAPLTATAIQPGQWRLDRVELVNWGTFQGHHVIDVARRGFLLTGHSGSGKSSLVDAITAVLTPGGKIHFNAAAADASSKRADRNIASYVRGAWRRQSDDTTGEVVSEYLRTGATWSAVGLRYSNGTADPPVTLIKLAHLRTGANTAADASVLHLLSTEPIDVMDLQPYARDGLEMRKIKSAWPQATVTERHSVFAERFCRLLGIGGENALVLLHKTQSAKNLGSLDDLFRGFMLDEPTTFAIADTAVEQFSDLSEAHTHVVTARRQIQHLSALRPHIATYDEHTATALHIEALHASLPAFAQAWKLELARTERASAEQRVRAADNDVATARTLTEEATGAHNRAVLLVSERGGQALANQRAAVERAKGAVGLVARERASIAGDLSDVGIEFPTRSRSTESCGTPRGPSAPAPRRPGPTHPLTCSSSTRRAPMRRDASRRSTRSSRPSSTRRPTSTRACRRPATSSAAGPACHPRHCHSRASCSRCAGSTATGPAPSSAPCVRCPP